MRYIRLFGLGLILVAILYACNLGRTANTDNPVNPVVGQFPALGLTVQAQNANSTFNTVGQTINYAYVATNTGGMVLVGPVTVTDDKATVSCVAVNSVGNLDNNLDIAESVACTSAYNITQADLNNGSVTNNATASAAGVNSNTVATVVQMTPIPVLTLTSSANPTSYSQTGQAITFTYSIKNTGAPTLGPAQFVVKDDRMGTVNCLGAASILAANETLTCTATYTASQNDLGVNQLVFNTSASGGGAGSVQPVSVTLTYIGAATNTPSSTLTRGSTVTHKVIEGEWMLQITRCYGADFNAVRNANLQVIDPDKIWPIDTLTIPNIGSNGTIYNPPCITFYTAQSGDTWNSIAQKYNADVAVLMEANKGVGLANGVKLRVPINSAGWGGSIPSGQPIPTACNRAELASDLTIPDGATVAPGSSFTKTWRLKNAGTCAWTSGYVLIFERGERMDSPATVPLTTGNVPPGATVDVSVTLKAPAAPGTYQADFRLRSSDNIVFGIGSSGQNTFWVKIVVSQSSTAKIAFSSNRDGNDEIYVMNPDGSEQVRLTNNAAADNSPVWSPDGARIAFYSNRDGNNEIYVMNADGANQVRLTNNAAADDLPVWSPNGGRIAFLSNRDGNLEIYVMNADGGNQVRLTNNATLDDLPAWSPDGNRIAFLSNRDGNLEIYVMNADGTNQVRLTNNAAADNFPVWSPDGAKIAFSSDRDGNLEIYVMNADGGNQVRLTNNAAADNSPVWAPGGGRLAFLSNRDGNPEIYVMNADGGNQIRVTNNAAADNSPVWAPGGGRLAFLSDRDGNVEIYAIRADGTNETRLTNNAAKEFSPVWRPSSQ